jgi:hypothetical protein
MEDKKNLIRMADKIQEALIKLKHSRYLELMRQLTTFAGKLQELTADSRKMGASLVKGWFSAAERCCKSVSRLLNDVPYSVSKIQQLTDAPQKEIPKLSSLVDELNQVQQEFGGLELDNVENTISVITEPINLDDVYLGPFRIQLELKKFSELYQNSPYYVIALEPNPAATDETVTHPHVSNEKLCEGDGCVTIRNALEEGRICDFFTMVRSILNTYNPDSPYVALYDWNGEPCYDCGYVMSSEDTYYCYYCEHDYCSQCSTYCRFCEETVCLGCSAECPHCEEMVCQKCIRRCTECKELCCKSCLEEDVCPTCKEEMEKEDEDQEYKISETNQDENPSQSETDKTEARLAS